MRDITRNTLVGLCTLGGFVGGAWLLLNVGEFEAMFRRTWQIECAFDEAGGLRSGSLVTLNGVPIGRVHSIEIGADRERPVTIVAQIDEGSRIPDPSVPSIAATLLGSGARLEFTAVLPLADPPRYYLESRPPILRGEVLSIEDRLTRAVDARLKPLSDGLLAIGELARNMNALLEPPAPGAEDQSIQTAVVRLNKVLGSVDKTLAAADLWLSDEQLKQDVKSAAYNANETLRAASTAMHRVAELADGVRNDTQFIRSSLVSTLDRASQTLDEVRRVTRLAADGQGTVGKLLNDAQLYEGLSDSAARLSDALAKLNLLLEKIQAEGLNLDLK